MHWLLENRCIAQLPNSSRIRGRMWRWVMLLGGCGMATRRLQVQGGGERATTRVTPTPVVEGHRVDTRFRGYDGANVSHNLQAHQPAAGPSYSTPRLAAPDGCGEVVLAAATPRHPRYEAHESPPLLVSLGYGLQFGLIASAALLVTPVIVAKASGQETTPTWAGWSSPRWWSLAWPHCCRCAGSGRLAPEPCFRCSRPPSRSRSVSRRWWTAGRQR